MDTEWHQWLSQQRDDYDLNADHILRAGIFYNALHSSGIDYAITPQPIVTHWNGLDSEEAYSKHGGNPESRELLAQNGWLDTTIDYELNSWGFRSANCAEFSTVTEPSLITMGCSFTFGTGLPQHTIWPQLAANGLGLSLINLGTPGHGLAMNTQWLLTQGHTIRDPKAIAIFMPPSGRATWYQRVPGNCHAEHLIGNTFAMTQWEKILPIMDNIKYNAHMDYVKNYYAIKLWARSRNISVHVFTGAEGHPSTYGLARDLAHQGVGWHRALSNRVIQRIKNT